MNVEYKPSGALLSGWGAKGAVQMETIKINSNEQSWSIGKELRDKGYKRTDNCYWIEIYTHPETGDKITLVRE